MYSEFVVGTLKIQRNMFEATAAFQSLLRLTLVGYKTVDTGAQKCLEARLRSIVISKVVLLKSVPEKVLGQVFRVLVIDIPFQSNVFVNRLPITVENGAERSLTNMTRPLLPSIIRFAGFRSR